MTSPDSSVFIPSASNGQSTLDGLASSITLSNFVLYRQTMSHITELRLLRANVLRRPALPLRPSARRFSSCRRCLAEQSERDPKLPPRLLSEVDAKGRPLPANKPRTRRNESDYGAFPKWKVLFGVIFIGVIVYDMVYNLYPPALYACSNPDTAHQLS